MEEAQGVGARPAERKEVGMVVVVALAELVELVDLGVFWGEGWVGLRVGLKVG